MSERKKIVVIGAGINGVSAAIWLVRAGHEVTLVDREGPGAGASYGNAGLLAQWAIIPVNTPGIALDGLKYALSPKSPLFLQWSHLPRMLPWLRRFVANSSDARARRTIEALIPILTDSVDQHRALTRGTKAEKWIATSDFLYAYEGRAAFDHDAYGWSFRRQIGMEPELIEGGAVQEVEPMLGPTVTLLARLTEHGHILNPGAYLADLAEVLDRRALTRDESRPDAVARRRSLFPDQLHFVDGDRMPCRVLSIDGETMAVSCFAGAVEFPLEVVQAVDLAQRRAVEGERIAEMDGDLQLNGRGCACDAGARPTSPGAWLVALVGLTWWRRRRRHCAGA